jgi:putative transposase
MRERKLIRLPGFDYTVSRYYFFTICVKDHIQSFGLVENGTMRLSENGIVALEQWKWLKDQYPYSDLIAFVVMPDHVHGIIHIDSDYYQNHVGNGGNNNVGNGHDRSLQEHINKNMKIKSLPELIGAYKTTVSKRIHLQGDDNFKWQKSFHDHIVRNQRSLCRIISYIETNPEKW